MVTSSIAVQIRHKVLVVDDDPVSLELMALLLAHAGHQVLVAGDAAAALDLLSKDDPSVLLVDLQMPDISGSKLAEKVRAMRNSGRRLLLLAMSATEAPEPQLLAFDGFLLKPLDLDDLRRALVPRKSTRRTGMRVVPSAKASSNRSPAKSGPAGALNMVVVNKLLTMMSEQALQTVFTACIADTRNCVENLRRQPVSGNVQGIRETAHRIKGAALMVGATRIAGLAGGLETGGDEEAATRAVLTDLLKACIELEGMLLAGKFKKIRAPHHEPNNRNHTDNA